jgi:hypothetical protein
MIAFLSRNYDKKQTTGHLALFDEDELIFDCKTLEPQWNDNAKGNSCIYEGEFKVVVHNSPTYGRCLKIIDVKGRTYILIHWGNYRNNTEGCILVGSDFKDVNNDGLKDVVLSRHTFDRLMQIIEDEFTLIIKGDEKRTRKDSGQ